MSIAEVAKRAGVSNATISRVINHQGGVAESTVANVRRAMEELGYKPAANRRGPKVGSRRGARVINILFLVFADGPRDTTTGFQRLVAGVSSQLDEQNANLAVKFVSSAQELRALNLSQPRIDGVLAHGATATHDQGVAEELTKLPTVWLMGNITRPTWGDQVMPDSDAIGQIAARHLVESGCDRLAHVNLLPGHWALDLHARAFAQAAGDLGVTAESVELSKPFTSRFFIDFDSSLSGRIAEAADTLVDDLLSRSPKVKGVFIAEDRQAAILVPALQRRGLDLSPGGDLTMVSCNNERPYLMGLNPAPPTIDIRLETIGRRGAAQLLWRMAEGNNDDRMRTTIEPSLVLPHSAETDDTKPADSTKEQKPA